MGAGSLVPGADHFGEVQAWNVDTGKQVWKHDYAKSPNWGGMLVTLLVATVGIVFSLPIGVVLALGRRSRLPIVQIACSVFIEFVRGVPLITVLFMANTMLPLFVPETTEIAPGDDGPNVSV